MMVSASSKKLLFCLQSASQVHSVVFGGDPMSLYALDRDFAVSLWDLKMRKVRQVFDQPQIAGVNSIALAGNASKSVFAAGGKDGVVSFYDVVQNQIQIPLQKVFFF